MGVPSIGDDSQLEGLKHEIEIPCSRADEVAMLVEARDSSVVEQNAAFIAHHRITHASGLEIGEPVGIDLVEKLACVGASHVKLAEGAHVDQTHAFAHSAIFAL